LILQLADVVFKEAYMVLDSQRVWDASYRLHVLDDCVRAMAKPVRVSVYALDVKVESCEAACSIT
jgi:hypothetical protein